MTKVKKLGLLVFCVLIAFAIPLLFSGCSAEQIETKDYKISDYNVIVNVGQAGAIRVHEEFTVTYYTNTLHGVQRYIPLNITAYYSKGNSVFKKKYRTEILNAKATPCATQGYDSGYYYFNLGSASSYVNYGDSVNYVVSYTLVLPDDRLSDKDVFYFNVLPCDWDASIDNASFTVNYSQKISAQDLKDMTAVYYGKAGSSDRLNSITFADSSVSGSISHLDAFSGVTVYTEFEEGVLGTKTNKFLIMGAIMLGLIILLALFFVKYFYKSRKVRQIVPTVEFVAPEGMTPAECGLIIDGEIDNRDLVSMIVYWASQGYLVINEKKKNITLKKNKDLDENAKSFEKTLFNCIFAKSDTVDIDQIPNFAEQVNLAKAQLQKDIKHTNFEPKSKTARKVFGFFTAFIPAVVTAIMFYYTMVPYGIFACVLEFFAIYLATLSYNYACDKQYYLSKGETVGLKLLGTAIIVIVCVLNMLAFEWYVDRFMCVLISHLLAIVLMYFGGKVLSRTEVSVQRLGKIIGLKNFILYTEKDRMEMMAKDNPQSFYHILPYAYVLNVTDVYCEKFKDVKLAKPDWYVSDMLSDNLFTTLYFMNVFSHCLNHTSTVLQNAITHNALSNVIDTISSVGGGGSGGKLGGGGFSGGGFGGGGGRGW